MNFKAHLQLLHSYIKHYCFAYETVGHPAAVLLPFHIYGAFTYLSQPNICGRSNGQFPDTASKTSPNNPEYN